MLRLDVSISFVVCFVVDLTYARTVRYGRWLRLLPSAGLLWVKFNHPWWLFLRTAALFAKCFTSLPICSTRLSPCRALHPSSRVWKWKDGRSVCYCCRMLPFCCEWDSISLGDIFESCGTVVYFPACSTPCRALLCPAFRMRKRTAAVQAHLVVLS